MNFFDLKGQKITKITGADFDSEDVVIETDKGVLSLYHRQDCCERVRVVGIMGNPDNLIGATIKIAYQDNIELESYKSEWRNDSSTWTHFFIHADNGFSIDLYWLGESNGYYSESVDIDWKGHDEQTNQAAQTKPQR